jgi:hypothetical protein
MNDNNQLEEKDLGNLVPPMNVNLPAQPQQQEVSNLVPDEMLVGIYGEIIDNLRKDREEIDGLLGSFTEMVMNEGDATSASKEALVNLMKIKSETADKMAKIADLMTRVKMRDRDTFPKYLAAHVTQNNNIKVDKRELIKAAEKEKELS